MIAPIRFGITYLFFLIAIAYGDQLLGISTDRAQNTAYAIGWAIFLEMQWNKK